MKDDDLLEEVVYLNITINKYLMKVSAEYSEIYFLLYCHAREPDDYLQVLKLWQVGCLAVYRKIRDRD